MKKINLFNKTMFPLSDGKGCPVERGGVWELPRRTPCATPSWKEGEHKVPSYRGNTESPRCCRELVCGKTDGIPLFSGMTVRICGMIIAIAALFATPSFAEPTELDKKTVASKAYVDTKQDIIQTGNVLFYDGDGTLDDPDLYVPGLVAYDPTTGSLKGNQIGILDQETIADDEGDLALYGGSGSGYGSEMDNYVPTVRAVAYALQNIWNEIPNSWQALSWNVNNDNGVNRTNAINAYNSTFGNGTNQWAGNSGDLINGEFLANSLALKQNKITTGSVEFTDGTMLPAITTYDATSGLVSNKIGILDQETIADDEGDLTSYSTGHGSEMDNFVPTVRAVSQALGNIWSHMPTTLYWNVNSDNGANRTNAINAYNTTFGTGTNQWAGTSTALINGQFLANSLALKQNKLPAKTTGNLAPKGNQAVVLNTAGNPSNVYTTAGKDLALTAKSGAQKVMNYIDGTTASATFATSQGFTEAKVKSALVSLELLKDVYGELNAKITNNALPTGTTGTVVTYNGTNANTGVQEFGETAIASAATYDDNDQLSNGNSIANVTLVETKQTKRVCGGYEPGHENDPDYCWLWDFPD